MEGERSPPGISQAVKLTYEPAPRAAKSSLMSPPFSQLPRHGRVPKRIFRFGKSASWAEAHMFWVKWLQRKRRRNRFIAVTIHHKLLSYEELKS